MQDGGDTFSQLLLKVLRAHPAGLSEFALIKQLESPQAAGFQAGCLQDDLSLFQTHFFLFHSLYRLGEQLAQISDWQLHIKPLCIQLIPVNSDSTQLLAQPDPLREYYLDLSNLDNTCAEDVAALLSQFWTRFLRDDARRDALHVLELEDPIDWPEIKARHRQLAMQHHPDRGGDNERLQAINAAMDVLARAHGKKHTD